MTKSLKSLLAILAAAIVALAFPSETYAQRGEKTFGLQTGYAQKNESAIAGIFFQYGFSRSFRVAAEMGCIFRHKDQDAFTLDFNAHFPLRITPSALQLYPLVGLNYSSWTLHNLQWESTDDVSKRMAKFGANLGAGFQIKATEALKLKIEAKYTLNSQYSTFVLSAGIGYCF